MIEFECPKSNSIRSCIILSYVDKSCFAFSNDSSFVSTANTLVALPICGSAAIVASNKCDPVPISITVLLLQYRLIAFL